jgi:methionine synthase II (cobalamin-independent)
MNPMTKTIDENTTIEEIVAHYPKLIRPLKQFGITCVACGEPVWGTLAENAQHKNITELELIIEKLNQIISESDGN